MVKILLWCVSLENTCSDWTCAKPLGRLSSGGVFMYDIDWQRTFFNWEVKNRNSWSACPLSVHEDLGFERHNSWGRQFTVYLASSPTARIPRTAIWRNNPPKPVPQFTSTCSITCVTHPVSSLNCNSKSTFCVLFTGTPNFEVADNFLNPATPEKWLRVLIN